MFRAGAGLCGKQANTHTALPERAGRAPWSAAATPKSPAKRGRVCHLLYWVFWDLPNLGIYQGRGGGGGGVLWNLDPSGHVKVVRVLAHFTAKYTTVLKYTLQSFSVKLPFGMFVRVCSGAIVGHYWLLLGKTHQGWWINAIEVHGVLQTAEDHWLLSPTVLLADQDNQTQFLD